MEKNELRTIISTRKEVLSTNLKIRALRNEKGRTELAIIIEEDTTLEQIENSWSLLKDTTFQIFQKEGIDINNYYQISRINLAALRLNEGFSYLELAMDVNFDILCNLIQANEYSNSGDMAGASQMISAVRVRLEGLGMKRDDAIFEINDSLQAIREGQAPWALDSGPVGKQRIVDFIRQIEREIRKGKIVIKKKYVDESINFSNVKELSDKHNTIWQKAVSLLNQLPNSGGLQKLERAHMKSLNSKKG